MSTLTQVSDATGRITVRRQRRRRRRLVWLAVAAAVVVLLGSAGWLVYGSPVLAVRSVEVSGNTLVSAEQVRELAAVAPGTPLARVDLDGAAARVAGLPQVASVSVVRSWPNTIGVRLVERTPMFALQTPGGYWIADDQGVIFTAAADPPRGLTVAEVAGNDARLVRDLATVLRALPAGVRSRVDTVSAETPDSIALRFGTGVRVIWGGAQQSELKAQVLVALLDQKGRVYDVSAPSMPTVK